MSALEDFLVGSFLFFLDFLFFFFGVFFLLDFLLWFFSLVGLLVVVLGEALNHVFDSVSVAEQVVDNDFEDGRGLVADEVADDAS